jgi:hypothetical protein
VISLRILCTLALSLAASAFLGDLHASTRRDDVPDSAYRHLGNRAAFKSVGRVEIDYGQGYEAIGTATLYGRDRLVSAAHVFDDSALAGAVGVRINFGKGRIQNIDFATPGVVNINPRYNSATLNNDVSVVFLPQPFTLAPARLYHGRRIKLSSAITFVGYGDTGTGLTGSRFYSIAKRGGQNSLDRYVNRGRDFLVDFDRPGTAKYNSLGSSAALSLEGLIGPGDSGGSVWVRKGRHWKVIGINDYGVDWFPNGRGNGIEDDYGDRSGFVYLPKYSAWMASLSAPPQTGNAQRSVSALGAVPEPGIVALLAIGGLVGGMTLRRRR